MTHTQEKSDEKTYIHKQYTSFRGLKKRIKTQPYLHLQHKKMHEEVMISSEPSDRTPIENIWGLIKPTYHLQDDPGKRINHLLANFALIITIGVAILFAIAFSPLSTNHIYEFNDLANHNDFNLLKSMTLIMALCYIAWASFFTYDFLGILLTLFNKKLSTKNYLLLHTNGGIKERLKLSSSWWGFIIPSLFFIPLAIWLNSPVNGYFIITSIILTSIISIISGNKKHPTKFYIALLNTFFYFIIFYEKFSQKLSLIMKYASVQIPFLPT